MTGMDRGIQWSDPRCDERNYGRKKLSGYVSVVRLPEKEKEIIGK